MASGLGVWGSSSWPPPLASGLGRGVSPLVAAPDLGRGVTPLSRPRWPRTRGNSSLPFLRHRSLVLSAAAPDLRRGVTPLGCRPSGMGPPGFCPWPRTWGGSSRPRLAPRRSRLRVPHHLLEFAQVHVHCISDAIQPSHPLSPSLPSVFSLAQHQGLFQWAGSSHQVAKVVELQLSDLPMSIQGWFPLRFTGLISLLSKGLSRVFSSTLQIIYPL